MKESNIYYLGIVLTITFYAIMIALLIYKQTISIKKHIDQTVKPVYNVYYEYDIYNNDTIAVDTIWEPIKY